MNRALEVRTVYYQIFSEIYDEPNAGERHIPKWDGGFDRARIYHQNVWKKIADFLERKNCNDIYGFIIANIKNGRLAYPNTLYSERAWKNYITAKEKNAYEIPAQYYKEAREFDILVQGYIDSGISKEDAIRFVIREKGAELSPLFRYIIAERISDYAAMDYFSEAARRQLNEAKESYLSSWPIPEILRNTL